MLGELSTALIAFTSTLIGTGGVSVFFYYRQGKEKKELENKLKAAELEKATIESKSQTWHLYEEQIEVLNKRIVDLLNINAQKETRNQELGDRYNQRVNEIEDRFNKQTEVLRTSNSKLNKALERINQLTYEKGKLKLVIQYLDHWKCYRAFGTGKEDCKRREPEQVVKKFKYIPLNEDLQVVLNDVKNESCEAVKEEINNG